MQQDHVPLSSSEFIEASGVSKCPKVPPSTSTVSWITIRYARLWETCTRSYAGGVESRGSNQI
jgi:hypothetical protein